MNHGKQAGRELQKPPVGPEVQDRPTSRRIGAIFDRIAHSKPAMWALAGLTAATLTFASPRVGAQGEDTGIAIRPISITAVQDKAVEGAKNQQRIWHDSIRNSFESNVNVPVRRGTISIGATICHTADCASVEGSDKFITVNLNGVPIGGFDLIPLENQLPEGRSLSSVKIIAVNMGEKKPGDGEKVLILVIANENMGLDTPILMGYANPDRQVEGNIGTVSVPLLMVIGP